MAEWDNPHLNHRNFHKGQIHCHADDGSGHDDGTQPLDEVVTAYRTTGGYDFLSVSRHNSTYIAPPEAQGMLFIPGTEDGRSDRHHMVVAGLDFERARAAPDVKRFDENGNGLCDWHTAPCENLPGRIYFYAAIQMPSQCWRTRTRRTPLAAEATHWTS